MLFCLQQNLAPYQDLKTTHVCPHKTEQIPTSLVWDPELEVIRGRPTSRQRHRANTWAVWWARVSLNVTRQCMYFWCIIIGCERFILACTQSMFRSLGPTKQAAKIALLKSASRTRCSLICCTVVSAISIWTQQLLAELNSQQWTWFLKDLQVQWKT